MYTHYACIYTSRYTQHASKHPLNSEHPIYTTTWCVQNLRGPGPFASGWTPLHIAAAYGNELVVQKLLSSKVRV